MCGETTFVIGARTKLASLLLGASLLGAYLALGQELPRPRPIPPPDNAGGDSTIVITEGTIEGDASPSGKKTSPERVPERTPVPLSETSEPKTRSGLAVDAPALLPDLPPVIPAGGMLPPPMDLTPPPSPIEAIPVAPPPPNLPPNPLPLAPPIAPDLAAPPPSPPTPPSNIKTPDLPTAPSPPAISEVTPPTTLRPEKAAPVTPWSPKEKIEEPRSAPMVPTNRAVEPPSAPSRFVVPRSSAKRPTEETAPVQIVTESPRPVQPMPPMPPMPPAQPEPPPIPRFDQVKIFHQASPAPLPTPAPSVSGMPTGFQRPPTPISSAPSADVGFASTVTPQLTIEKRGPFYHKAGATLAYQIILKNIGPTIASGVRIEDEIPGMTLRSAVPPTDFAQGNRLAWVVATLRPGEDKTFLLELVPNRVGDLVSTTSVVITQSTSFRTKQEEDGESAGRFKTPPPMPNFDLPPTPPVSRLPQPIDPTPGPALVTTPNPLPSPLTVDVKPMAAAAVGQKVTIEVVIANKGTIPLSQLMLIGTLPSGLKHPAGDSIGADLPDLGPGETKTFKMPVTAIQVGMHTVEIRVKSKDNEVVTKPQIEVFAPNPGSTSNASPAPIQQASASGLQVSIQSRDAQVGLGRETIAVVNLANLGVIPASNVQLTLFLSDGLEATQNAQAPVPYRVSGKRIFFESIAGMPADRRLIFPIGVRAVGVGEQNIRVQVTSDQERTPVWRDLRLTVVR
jgi:uncharacterized repeat protein (TIGR01451 family)